MIETRRSLLTSCDGTLSDDFDRLECRGDVVLACFVSLENIHRQVVVAALGQGVDAIQKNVVDAKLQVKERVENRLHQLSPEPEVSR